MASIATKELRFVDADLSDDTHVDALVRWANDDAIRHLFLRFEGPQQYATAMTAARVRDKLGSALAAGRVLLMIEWRGQLVGEVSLDLDSKALLDPVENTAWFGLVIGEKRARGQGLGRAAMLHIEDVARAKGAVRAEIGVFEFNERAQHLYRSLGYQELASIPSYTWWKDSVWTDIRMGKSLLPLRS